tara:strand:- start:3585 stop:4064 length:480 start_codon:yes stop_codon:yes gene_type:complete
MVLFVTLASCSKDEDVVTAQEEANFAIDVNLAQETDWEMANEILVLVNDHRATLGLAPIQRDQQYASAYAVQHTQYMIEKSKINHDNFGERRQALTQRGAVRVGENVGYGYDTAEAVVHAWLNSPSHRDLIEGNYSHAGFGVLQNAKGSYYFTQLFYKK